MPCPSTFPTGFPRGMLTRSWSTFARSSCARQPSSRSRWWPFCWALAEWSYVVETSGTWMDDRTALRAVQLAKLYLQTHMLMARRSLLSGQPRWKIRPRMHSFACEISARMENGSRMSPREAACWGDESWIGRTCHVGLAPAVHTSTLHLRIL